MTKPRVAPWIQDEVRRDIEDAISRKDPVSLRSFGAEAEASGMLEESSRAYETAGLIESWLAKEKRAELLRIKAASTASSRAETTRIKSVSEPLAPSQADLARAFDAMWMNQAAPFDRVETPDLERRRVEHQNKQLAEKNRQAEERARQVADDGEPEVPYWRR